MTHAIRDCLLVAFGGALGSLVRYGTGVATARVLGKGFPWGTLLVNVAGCFAMGIVLAVIADLEAPDSKRSRSTRVLAQGSGDWVSRWIDDVL
jgi:fluoride ion exporter CrcB/FEX